MVTLGVDACKKGWVAVELTDGAFTGARFGEELRPLLDATPRADVVGVDMPLGLLDKGWRQADTEAKGLLGPGRANSVFRVPPRAVWPETDYEAANLRCRRLTGSGLSRQTWRSACRTRRSPATTAGRPRSGTDTALPPRATRDAPGRRRHRPAGRPRPQALR